MDPTLNALAWGAIATWHVCVVAGAFFALIARTPFQGLTLKITAAQLAPYLATGAVIALLTSHVVSFCAKRMMEIGRVHINYKGVPAGLLVGWHACNMRNRMGYFCLSSGVVVFSIAMIAARARLFVL